MLVVCEQCGTELQRRVSEISPHNFCTKKCRGVHTRLQPPKRSLQEVLDAKSIPEPNSGCVLFFGAWNSDGYGSLAWNRQRSKTHRWAWIARHGFIPDGLSVLHKCDVRCCINPDHLFLGTQIDNIADMTAKKRYANPALTSLRVQGEKHGMRKLNDNLVRQIRKDKRPETIISAETGISRSVVGMVRRRQAWWHVSDEPEGAI